MKALDICSKAGTQTFPPCILLATLFTVGGGKDVLAAVGSAVDNDVVAISAKLQSRGFVTFDIGNEQKRFAHLPVNENRFNEIVSTVWAKPAPEESETFAITFFFIDLRQQAYPAELPSSVAIGQWTDPLLGMATVGFAYVNAHGQEWAGFGKVQVQSFGADGLLEGTFNELSLTDADKSQPDVVLRNGRFRARIEDVQTLTEGPAGKTH